MNRVTYRGVPYKAANVLTSCATVRCQERFYSIELISLVVLDSNYLIKLRWPPSRV